MTFGKLAAFLEIFEFDPKFCDSTSIQNYEFFTFDDLEFSQGQRIDQKKINYWKRGKIYETPKFEIGIA